MNSSNQNKDDLDKKLVHSLLKARIPSLKQVKYIGKVVTPKELLILRLSFFALLGSIVFIFFAFFLGHIEKQPASGGEYIEGLVGAPKYINPLYSSARDVDSDISSLIYSSLFKRNALGELVSDLVQSYEISDDGLVYNVSLRDDIKWHSGENLSVDDVVYTFNLIKDASFESPLRLSFSGVEIERIGNSTVKFTLSQPYSGFLDLLVFGILPQDLWYQISSNSFRLAELNLKPIGSGPYKFKSLAKDKSGVIKLYNLTYNEDYYGDEPYIKNISFKFFQNFEEVIGAFSSNSIDGISYLPPSVKEDILVREPWNFYDLDLPQLTAIFFNQERNKNLSEKNVRVALSYAINRANIIEKLGGTYHEVYGSILPQNFAYNEDIKKFEYDKKRVADLFEIGGWSLVEVGQEELLLSVDTESSDKKNDLAQDKTNDAKNQDIEAKKILGEGSWLTKKVNGKSEYIIVELTTVDTVENQIVVNAIKEDWEAIGVKTIINAVPVNQPITDLIKNRDFQALFYGQLLLPDPDVYAYWHSSQVGKNGLNIAGFKNNTVDKLLEEARGLLDKEERINKYEEIQMIISEEIPAIYLYSPTYTYVQSKKVKGFDVKSIVKPSDRFSNVNAWHILTKRKFTF
ncbi:peptide ABC transporter substrate-binding protein [Patescibacteria group bacterium]|nr:peptide ABC transporter substrate-binding protein [Patescibacteria group bacterium]